MVRTLLPPRNPEGHKGTFGKVYVYGGCVGYTGAPVYAGEAAVRTGSGLVFVGVPGEIYPIVASRCEAAMAQPVPRDYGALLERMEQCDAALIGPGLGRAGETEETVLALLRDLSIPVVLDADGINAVSTHMYVLDHRRGVTVLTPHEGEFARLDGGFLPGGTNRARAAADFAAHHNCVMVLKGSGTIVAGPGGRILRNTTGNCGMAKGGSGDILAGMLLSLLGQGAGALEAAACAVWLHGRAGDLAEAELTAYAMTPPDLLARLPAAFKELVET
ncbi:MAG: NAD(P)H-hydrate dehydratase [Oscillibacter sp.]|nr:NAD(P)H-hydrate dehydratase [Oscillibacter sp.]